MNDDTTEIIGGCIGGCSMLILYIVIAVVAYHFIHKFW